MKLSDLYVGCVIIAETAPSSFVVATCKKIKTVDVETFATVINANTGKLDTYKFYLIYGRSLFFDYRFANDFAKKHTLIQGLFETERRE